jgi:uncharacterized protein
MSALTTHTTIPKIVSSQDDLDFQFLKKIGIEYIESLGGKLWTDYNEHDPGVTILEMLCYAITDLGNRIELPIENLLAKEDGSGFGNQFFSASEILPNRALTPLDYRKLFIDIDGVRNCWLSKHKKTVYVNCRSNELSYNPKAFSDVNERFLRQFDYNGLYDLLVDFDIPNFDKTKKDYKKKVAAFKASVESEIRKKYHANRNLCEDLIDISSVGVQPILVCANIELDRDVDEDWVQAKIYFEIQRYFAPSVHFYTLKEMIAKGYRTDEIFDGPLLDHGFIDTAELKKTTLRSQVRLSDIMNIISSIEGVKVIKDITIGNCDGSDSDDWVICIDPNKRPELCSDAVFNFTKDVIPVVVSEEKVKEHLAELEAAMQLSRELSGLDKILELPEAKYLDTDWYTTIQNDFPDTYGISPFGLPSTATEARKSQAKQLKAYLLFFDQILASYFSQLGVVRDLLSLNSDLSRTYFTQAVQDIRDFDQLISPTDYPANNPELLAELLLEPQDDISERKNQLLDHLISRFAERFSEYTFLMKELYGSASTELTVQSKQEFLQDYHLVSGNRGGALNYYQQPNSNLWNTENVSGAERRIARLGGFKDKGFRRRNIANSYVDIYPSGTKFRWRIKDDTNTIVISSTVDYQTYSKAVNELHLTVLHIIQTNEKQVENAYENGEFTDGAVIGNILIQVSNAGSYSFDVIDKTSANPNYIIARHYTQHATAEALKDVILGCIDFMKYRFTEEGIFLVEHILLRPDITLPLDTVIPQDEFLPVHLDDCVNCNCIDPYSYRVSIVLPGYTQRFSNIDFRNFLEELIREELPAHVVPKICWVGERKGHVPDTENDLIIFEKAFKRFLIERTDLGQGHDPASLRGLIEALGKLNTIYPSGSLYSCVSEDLEGKIILGRTNLGTL